jgi:beta-glucosidase-like glycosyl hydrolase
VRLCSPSLLLVSQEGHRVVVGGEEEVLPCPEAAAAAAEVEEA